MEDHTFTFLAATILMLTATSITLNTIDLLVTERTVRMLLTCVANNAIRRARGNPFPDEVLIPMFDNALPPAYSTIRQLIRQHNNTNFTAHIPMYMSQVKAELACRPSA